jgi:hypothetical protein
MYDNNDVIRKKIILENFPDGEGGEEHEQRAGSEAVFAFSS